METFVDPIVVVVPSLREYCGIGAGDGFVVGSATVVF